MKGSDFQKFSLSLYQQRDAIKRFITCALHEPKRFYEVMEKKLIYIVNTSFHIQGGCKTCKNAKYSKNMKRVKFGYEFRIIASDDEQSFHITTNAPCGTELFIIYMDSRLHSPVKFNTNPPTYLPEKLITETEWSVTDRISTLGKVILARLMQGFNAEDLFRLRLVNKVFCRAASDVTLWEPLLASLKDKIPYYSKSYAKLPNGSPRPLHWQYAMQTFRIQTLNKTQNITKKDYKRMGQKLFRVNKEEVTAVMRYITGNSHLPKPVVDPFNGRLCFKSDDYMTYIVSSDGIFYRQYNLYNRSQDKPYTWRANIGKK